MIDSILNEVGSFLTKYDFITIRVVSLVIVGIIVGIFRKITSTAIKVALVLFGLLYVYSFFTGVSVFALLEQLLGLLSGGSNGY